MAKEKVHVSLSTDTLTKLEETAKKTSVSKSLIMDTIIAKGIEEIRKLNYNFAQYKK